MKAQSRISSITIALLALCVSFPARADSKDAARNPFRFEFTHPALETRFRVVVYCPSEQSIPLIEHTVIRRLAEMEEVFDPERASSEVFQIHANAGIGSIRASDDLYDLLKQADRLSIRSRGAFDITAEPASALWRTCMAEKRLPTAEELAAVRPLVKAEKLQLNAIARTVGLADANMRFDFTGVLPGYACDRILAALTRAGFPNALVATDHCIVVGEAPPGREFWNIEVMNAPVKSKSRIVRMKRLAIASSNHFEEIVEIAGRRYLPIVNPLTAMGSPNTAAVTVVSRRAWHAAALARTAAVLGPTDGRTLLKANAALRSWFYNPPGAAALSNNPAEPINGLEELADPQPMSDEPSGDEPPIPTAPPPAQRAKPRTLTPRGNPQGPAAPR